MKADFFARNNLVYPGDLCFDVGVRDGKITKELLALDANVICIDANPNHAIRMRELFGFSVYVVSAAVMDKPGTGTLYSTGGDRFTMVPSLYGQQFGKVKDAFGDEQKVRTTTLDELAELFGVPDFIKLDIEGAERWALAGMTFRPRGLVYEWGAGYIKEAYRCAELLGDGYEFNYVEGHHGELLGEWVEAGELNIDMPMKDGRGRFTWGNVICRKK